MRITDIKFVGQVFLLQTLTLNSDCFKGQVKGHHIWIDGDDKTNDTKDNSQKTEYKRQNSKVAKHKSQKAKVTCRLPYALANEPPHGKTNNLHRRKQRRRSASR